MFHLSIPLLWFRFLLVSVHSHSMCSVVSDTPQKGHSGDGVFSLTCIFVARVYPVLSLDTNICSFLLRLVESSFHSIVVSFLNLMVYSSCAHLSCLFFASVFFIQLIRSCGGYSSRALKSSANAFFAASSALSFLVIPEWLGIHISLTLPFSWSSSSLFVHLVP
jgi:hypothetical protein